MSTATAPQPDARERLLDAAEALIYTGGIHATGVDAIVREAGAARKSFYTWFGSKDALVAAVLTRRDERWMHWFVDGTLKRGHTPRTRLLGMFDVLRDWFMAEGFHGCAFLNASGETASADDPVRLIAREHKARLLAFVREQCDALVVAHGMDRRHAARLARQWLILIDGAIGVALVSGDADAALDARTAAKSLLEALVGTGALRSRHSSRPPARRTARSLEKKHD
ncbi:MAG: TetR/AcrR family transcriptional regulator [Paraburkholderia sp.]|uniref:TetR/AcrR family transcriptional regulator n=1 Tax=Paraburkholderia sp. TaxID=1926495 RepID=UPI00122B28F3|nr:TetR/AcrR family transcriptional regulator [Paraburkholderia sp.]TAM06824.1 MAG: TetR/AcrR family transcriptional regulator [Paraburkholderia sp.]TAM29411.1 MAG: TetR/AcrR family transcriptional regulator [Paraburkholderia sp.]